MFPQGQPYNCIMYIPTRKNISVAKFLQSFFAKILQLYTMIVQRPRILYTLTFIYIYCLILTPMSHYILQWAITISNEPLQYPTSHYNLRWVTTISNVPLQSPMSHYNLQWATTNSNEPLQHPMSHYNIQWATKISNEPQQFLMNH